MDSPVCPHQALLGRLEERSEATLRAVERIDSTLTKQNGDIGKLKEWRTRITAIVMTVGILAPAVDYRQVADIIQRFG